VSQSDQILGRLSLLCSVYKQVVGNFTKKRRPNEVSHNVIKKNYLTFVKNKIEDVIKLNSLNNKKSENL